MMRISISNRTAMRRIHYILIAFVIAVIQPITVHSDSVEQKNKELVTRFINEAYNLRNMETVNELVDSAYVEHTNGITANTSEIVKQTVAWLAEEAPDFKLVIDDIMAENDHVAVRWIYSGFNIKFEKQVIVHGIYICRCNEGKIVEGWQIFDNLGRFKQLGYTLTPPIKNEEN